MADFDFFNDIQPGYKNRNYKADQWRHAVCVRWLCEGRDRSTPRCCEFLFRTKKEALEKAKELLEGALEKIEKEIKECSQ